MDTSQLNKSLIESISLNNTAATMIRSGNYTNALSALRLALQKSKEAIKSKWVQEEELGEACYGHPLDDLMARNFAPSPSHDDVDSRDAFIYRLPMEVPTSVEANSGFITHLSVCIVFNLALTHHRAAIDSNQEAEEFGNGTNNARLLLRKAAKFYQSLFGLLQRDECQHGSGFFTITVLNNLGHVHQALDESENATQCFRHLLSTLMFVVDGGGLLNQIGPDYFECFFHSTSHLIVSNCSASAA